MITFEKLTIMKGSSNHYCLGQNSWGPKNERPFWPLDPTLLLDCRQALYPPPLRFVGVGVSSPTNLCSPLLLVIFGSHFRFVLKLAYLKGCASFFWLLFAGLVVVHPLSPHLGVFKQQLDLVLNPASQTASLTIHLRAFAPQG